jgi:hypothetical protein
VRAPMKSELVSILIWQAGTRSQARMIARVLEVHTVDEITVDGFSVGNVRVRRGENPGEWQFLTCDRHKIEMGPVGTDRGGHPCPRCRDEITGGDERKTRAGPLAAPFDALAALGPFASRRINAVEWWIPKLLKPECERVMYANQ